MEVVVVRARGPLSETVLYGIDLPPGSEEVFQINSTSGNITVGLRGPTSLVVRNQMQTIFRLDVFAYYLSSGINGSRVRKSKLNVIMSFYACYHPFRHILH